MTRHVFFSFHHENDLWRANQVRNSWVTKPDRESAGYVDAATWESVKRQGDQSIIDWINRQLSYTSVTAVLIGRETASRRWVRYEIARSIDKGNGLLGIYVNGLEDRDGSTDQRGPNPFDYLPFDNGRPLSQMFHTYDWILQDGYNNLATWVERAASQAGR